MNWNLLLILPLKLFIKDPQNNILKPKYVFFFLNLIAF